MIMETNLKGGPPGSKEQDGDRFIEIWNLVFMQYEQVSKEKRINLPKPSVDTWYGPRKNDCSSSRNSR